MTTDLTTRIAELTAAIEELLSGDELTATVAAGAAEASCWLLAEQSNDAAYTAFRAHIARNDPARVLRRVAATRSLVAAIQAEQHDWNPLEEYYSCSQARENTGTLGLEIGPPGSGCSDPDRKGDPCDCGRNHRVARLLGIIASEWEA